MSENVKKRKCIFLPGDLTGSFVVNELQFLKDSFDEVFVLAYIENEGSFDEIIKRFSFKGEQIKKPSVSLLKMRKWNRLDYVKEEKRNAMRRGNPSLVMLAKRWVYLQMYGAFSVASSSVIDREISNFDGDVYLYAFWLSRPAFTAAQYKGRVKKIFSRAHGYDLFEERNAAKYLPFRKFIQENLDDICFISQDGKRYFDKLLEDKGVAKETGARHRISRLGTFQVDSLNSERKVTQSEIDVQGTPSVVVASCSSVEEFKRLDLIIDIVKKLQDDPGIPDVRWIHIGDGSLMDNIKNLAEEKLVKGSFAFKGFLANEDVIKTYVEENARFFINMSNYEGIPVSIMEAMSAGLFPIAREVGGIPELVDNECGLLVESDLNLDRVVEFVREHISDAYSDKAYQKWESEYSAVNNYKRFYEDVVS